MKDVLAVFVGGGAGSLARYGFSKIFAAYAQYPVATLLANSVSCLVLGMIVALVQRTAPVHPVWLSLGAVGFCGGFSTFSTLIRENVALAEQQRIFTAITYTLLSLLLGFSAFGLGIWLINRCILR